MKKVLLLVVFSVCIYPLNVMAYAYPATNDPRNRMSVLPVLLFIHLVLGNLLLGYLKKVIVNKVYADSLNLRKVVAINYLSFIVSYITATFVIATGFNINLYGEYMYFSTDYYWYLLIYFGIYFIVSSLLEFPLYYLLMKKESRDNKTAIKYSITANAIVYTLSYALYELVKIYA